MGTYASSKRDSDAHLLTIRRYSPSNDKPDHRRLLLREKHAFTTVVEVVTCEEESLKFMGYIGLYKAQSTHSSSPRQKEKGIRFNMLISIAYLGAVVRSALERWPYALVA